MAETNIKIKCRFLFLAIWEAKAAKGSTDLKYSACLVIDKKDVGLIAAIKAAVDEALKAGINSKWNGKKPNNLKLPLHDGDLEREDDPAFAGKYFINASGNRQPGIARWNGSGVEIMEDHEAGDFYSGCYGVASVNFYPFTSASSGVACGLNNVLKVKDGERMSGGVSAETDFADVNDLIEGFNESDDDLFG